jgi:leucyl-tRNA synthetase
MGFVSFDEPFKRLFTQGMIVKDGAKMSKSKGNVVSPDGLIADYGADTVRLYTLFIGPPEKDAEWSDKGVDGAFRFIKRLWNLNELIENAPEKGSDAKSSEDLTRKMHQTVKKVTEDIDGEFHFNTAISAAMELVNLVYSGISEKGRGCFGKDLLKTVARNTVLLVAPFVPHIAEEMWEMMNEKESIFKASWPAYDKDMLLADTVEIPVQFNGKLRGKIEVKRGTDDDGVKAAVMSDPQISVHLSGKPVRKWIILKDRLVNIVV